MHGPMTMSTSISWNRGELLADGWLIVPADATTIKLRVALRRDLHTTLKVVLSFAPGPHRAVFGRRDLVAHLMKGCSMKRKSTISGMRNSLVYARTKTQG